MNNKERVTQLLKQEVKSANRSGKPLKWIGFQIPPGFAISSKFKVNVYLNYANFLGNTFFHSSNFESNASFSGAQFNGKANFDKTTFNREANFSDAYFNGVANFSDAIFNEWVRFSDTTFNGRADFYHAKFTGEATFVNKSSKGDILFYYAFFKSQERIRFNGDLSRVSSANTDITRVRFGDRVIWGRRERSSEKGTSEEGDYNNVVTKGQIDFKIHDERIIEKDVKEANRPTTLTNSLEAVITEYRNLRENYEYYLRYEEAGQFFIREMELSRKYKQKSSIAEDIGEIIIVSKIKKKNIVEQIFSFAALYYAVSKYGESTRIPLAITTLIFLAATLFFWSQKGWSTTDEAFSDSISRTVTSFFPFFSLPENYGFLDVVLRATMIPMAGLLFITLRRKLERRFRH